MARNPQVPEEKRRTIEKDWSQQQSQTSKPAAYFGSTTMARLRSLALPTSTHSFPPMQHPITVRFLTFISTYLTSPNFRIDEMESFVNGHRERTRVHADKNQERDLMLSSAGGSLGRTGVSLPSHSPPHNIL
ncbi:hypothetical protein BDP27DRAFT_1426440 [Rhodocollybia butyracea]|uniref:Uncharacterized protein n=1 Tax=Rhodocollybia butyracea TaxID=206335 RepID=A0A9P5U1P9_9AGAR|nr:hypothetical protein BDP27DRAFT_1426440 [Rhodocollybia butyracea]